MVGIKNKNNRRRRDEFVTPLHNTCVFITYTNELHIHTYYIIFLSHMIPQHILQNHFLFIYILQICGFMFISKNISKQNEN